MVLRFRRPSRAEWLLLQVRTPSWTPLGQKVAPMKRSGRSKRAGRSKSDRQNTFCCMLRRGFASASYRNRKDFENQSMETCVFLILAPLPYGMRVFRGSAPPTCRKNDELGLLLAPHGGSRNDVRELLCHLRLAFRAFCDNLSTTQALLGQLLMNTSHFMKTAPLCSRSPCFAHPGTEVGATWSRSQRRSVQTGLEGASQSGTESQV